MKLQDPGQNPRRSLRRTRRWLLLVPLSAALSLVAGLAAIELGFRWLAPQALLFENASLLLPDRDLGFRLCPSVVQGGALLTNSLGLRDHEVSVRKRPGTLRVLALGDSFTYGITALEDTWPKLLERNLRKRFPGRTIEVLNAGVPCYSTYQELAYLERSLLQLDPDVVVLGFFVGNDFDDNILGIGQTAIDGELVGAWEAGRLEGHAPVPKPKPPGSAAWEEPAWPAPLPERAAPALRARLRRWFRRLHAVRWARRRILATRAARAGGLQPLPPAAEPLSEARLRQRQEQQTWYAGLLANHRLAVYTQETFSPEGLEKTRLYLGRLAEVLRGRRIALVVLVIPDEVQVHPKVLRFVLKSTQGLDRRLDLELPQRRLAEILEPLGVPRVDVLPQFRRHGARKRLYRPWDTHWNEQGNALGAQMLAAYLQSVGLQPPLPGEPGRAPRAAASGASGPQPAHATGTFGSPATTE
jgi:hypothetical protein